MSQFLIPMIPSDILIEDLLLCLLHMKLSTCDTVQMCPMPDKQYDSTVEPQSSKLLIS